MGDDKNLSVFDMIDAYSAEQDIDPDDIFAQKPTPVSAPTPEEETPQPVEPETAPEPEQPKEEAPAEQPAPKKRKPRQPRKGINKDLVADMPEMTSGTGAVYRAKDYKENPDPLINGADEEVVREGDDAMSDMNWKTMMIEEAKARHNIDKLHIPPGEMQVKMLLAASDDHRSEAQKALDEVLAEIDETYPEWIEYKAEGKATKEEIANDDKIIQGEFGTKNSSEKQASNSVAPLPKEETEEESPAPSEENQFEGQDRAMDPRRLDLNDEAVKITIDKRNVPEVSWTEEEIEKIRKSRTVELNIVDGVDVEFGDIQDVDTSNIDAILSQYQRKTNDIVGVLPASKYRATFSGLTYPEVIDLSTSNEMNNLDGERKKWSICFDHIKNQSIGPWQEYYTYKDPKTKKTVRVSSNIDVPSNVNDNDVHFVSRFEDFLRKTSYMDLEFMLWKILCATAMDEEIVSIECNSRTNGKVCGNSYDWVYRPTDLLDENSISLEVLESMKETGEASTTEEIMNVYKKSPVHANSYVKLPTSGMMAVFGHISAYEYINDIYSKIKELDKEDNNDPTMVSRAYAYTVLTCIKAFIIQDQNGNYQRITGTDNLIKVILSLDEIDWETVSKLTEMMIEPYQFKFAMKDIVCPKCHSRSAITIESMSRLLFLLARSLQSVQVTLIRN